MKRASIILLSFYILTTQAQERIVAKAYYQLSLKHDSTDANAMLQEIFLSTFSNDVAHVRSYSQEHDDSVRTATFQKSGTIASSKPRSYYSKKQYIIDVKGEKAFYRTSVIEKLTLEQPYPICDWVILQDTSTIAGFPCQMARGTYGGRTYDAWFTTQVPLPFGPWKLHGLPGLIIRAESNDQRIRFELIGLQQAQDMNETLHIVDKSYPMTTWKDYRRLADLYNADPVSYLSRKLQRLGGSGSFRNNAGVAVEGQQIPKPRKRDILLPDEDFNYLLEVDEVYF